MEDRKGNGKGGRKLVRGKVNLLREAEGNGIDALGKKNNIVGGDWPPPPLEGLDKHLCQNLKLQHDQVITL